MSSDNVTYKLAYFNGKGLAELSRTLLAATETPFEDFRYPFSIVNGKYIKPEFDAEKESLPMGQVPLLTVTNGENVVRIPQSKAIERYISRKTGLLGSNDEEAALIDSVCELVLDMKTRHQAAKEDEVKLTTYFSETFPQYIAYAENFIKASSSGWCVGSKISQADITLFHFLTAYFDASVDIATKLPPGVATLVGKVGANPGIAKWVAGRATRGDIF